MVKNIFGIELKYELVYSGKKNIFGIELKYEWVYSSNANHTWYRNTFLNKRIFYRKCSNYNKSWYEIFNTTNDLDYSEIADSIINASTWKEAKRIIKKLLEEIK